LFDELEGHGLAVGAAVLQGQDGADALGAAVVLHFVVLELPLVDGDLAGDEQRGERVAGRLLLLAAGVGHVRGHAVEVAELRCGDVGGDDRAELGVRPGRVEHVLQAAARVGFEVGEVAHGAAVAREAGDAPGGVGAREVHQRDALAARAAARDLDHAAVAVARGAAHHDLRRHVPFAFEQLLDELPLRVEVAARCGRGVAGDRGEVLPLHRVDERGGGVAHGGELLLVRRPGRGLAGAQDQQQQGERAGLHPPNVAERPLRLNQ